MLEFNRVSKTYQGKAGEVAALNGLTFRAREGESLALIGPSGSGKSTALLLAAGLLAASEGEVLIHGEPVVRPRLKTGLILQDYGLLPWKTVFENADLGLRIRKTPRRERAERTQDILEQVGLKEFTKNYPGELSGGMRQRLALARVLGLDVDLLLMDERKGTDSARHLGLSTIGVFGVLLEAKRQNRISQVMPLVDRLVSDLKFFASAALRQKIAQLAGE